jgi:hypothetical protein
MTIASCANKCAKAGYEIAAMEYSYQCFCDNTVSIVMTFNRPITYSRRSEWAANLLRPRRSAIPSVRATKPRRVEAPIG